MSKAKIDCEENMKITFDRFYIKKRRKLHDSGFHLFEIEGIKTNTGERVVVSRCADVLILPDGVSMDIPKNDAISIWSHDSVFKIKYNISTFEFIRIPKNKI